MNITSKELNQIEKWRITILDCHTKSQTLWDPNKLSEQAKIAESAFRLFAAHYAKDLLANDFPRQNGHFWEDMQSVVAKMEECIKEAHITKKHATQKPHRPRNRELTNVHVAELFDRHAKPLIRRHLKNDEGEYETYKHGKHKGKRVEHGHCSVATIKNWIKKYPDSSKAHPDNGFHAGMLTDTKALEESEQQWKRYVNDYAHQFEEWRKVHQMAKRTDFRYKKVDIIHFANLRQ